MATILRLTCWGVVLMLAFINEVHVTTRNGVMAHAGCLATELKIMGFMTS